MENAQKVGKYALDMYYNVRIIFPLLPFLVLRDGKHAENGD
jgi:hypothetical protein